MGAHATSIDAAADGNPHREAARKVARGIDNLPTNGLHLLIASVCFIGGMIDSLEIAMTSVLGTVLSSPDQNVSERELRMVMSSSIAGMTIGTPLFGLLSDRFGRRALMLPILAVSGIACILSGLSPSLTGLAFWRFVCGLGFGGYMAIEVIYLIENLPARNRGKWVMGLTCIGGAIGGTGAKLLTRAFNDSGPMGLEGWQVTLVAGGLAAIPVSFAMLLLPESPRWLASKGRLAAADKVCARFQASRALVRSAKTPVMGDTPAAVEQRDPAPPTAPANYKIRLALFCTLMFLAAWAISAFSMLSGIVFTRSGHNTGDALLFSAIALLGTPVGALLGTAIIDRFPRPVLLSVCFGVSAVSGLVFALAAEHAHVVAVAAGFCCSVAGMIIVNGLKLLGGEIFPTASRGVTGGVGFATNRVGALLVPLALLPLLYAVGHVVVFVLISATLVGAALLVLSLPRNTTGRSID